MEHTKSVPEVPTEQDSNLINYLLYHENKTFPEFMAEVLGSGNKPDIDDYMKYEIINAGAPEYPITLSKPWLPITEMNKLYTFSVSFMRNLNYLKNEKNIVGWKKVRGDGNCYYRAVMARHLENLHKYYYNSNKLQDFLAVIKSCSGLANENKIYEESVEYFIKYITDSITLKENDSIGCFIRLMESLQDRIFDENLIKIGRLLTFANFIQLRDNPDFAAFVVSDQNAIIKDILTMGTEGGELALILLPLILNTQIITYNFFEARVAEQYFPDSTPKEYDKIHLIRRSGHYDLLYTLQEQEAEQYCFMNSTYYLYSAKKSNEKMHKEMRSD